MEYQVNLTTYELQLASFVGWRRQLHAVIQDKKDAHGIDPAMGWGVHVNGACGELAVAKLTGRYWDGSVDTYKAGGDMGAQVNIRTRSLHHYELIVRPGDTYSGYWILVTGVAPRFIVRGYVFGQEIIHVGRVDDFGNGRPPAYVVSHDKLRDMADLFATPLLTPTTAMPREGPS